jgi:endonuclease YncB( thermonuclease family)
MKMRKRKTRTTLASYLRRKRARKWTLAAAGLCLLGALAWADHRGWLLYAGDDQVRFEGRAFRVLSVVSGDSLEIEPAGPGPGPGPGATPGAGSSVAGSFGTSATPADRGIAAGRSGAQLVRLCGVVAPAPAGHHGAKTRTLGQQAVELAAKLCASGPVRVELPGDGRGLSGALRVYVYLSDGTCLNQTMIEAGMARCDGSFHRRGAAFAAAQRKAQQQRLGMWTNWQTDEEDAAGAEADNEDE